MPPKGKTRSKRLAWGSRMCRALLHCWEPLNELQTMEQCLGDSALK